jgi:hypothetical protein
MTDRCEEAVELARLVATRDRLAASVDAVDAAQRQAQSELSARSEAMIRIEEAVLRGDKVTAAERQQAEEALQAARLEVAAPWPERREAARRSARAARDDVARFVGANIITLLEDLGPASRAAADRINAAAQEVLAAYAERAAVEAEVLGLIALTRRVEPRDVGRTRAETLAREAERLLAVGEDPVTVHILDELQQRQPVSA